MIAPGLLLLPSRPRRPLVLLAVAVVVAWLGSASAASADPPESAAPARSAEPARPSCGATGSADTAADRDAVAAWIAKRRAEAELPPLAPQAVLCRVAQERAEEVARADSVDATAATVSQVSRRLLASGYAAHLWTERAILGYRAPAEMVRVWADSGGDESSFRKTVLGDFEDFGVGVAPGDGGTAVVLLFATPRSSWFRQQVRPLEDLEAVRREALARVNRARKEAGRRPVEADPDLDRAAQAHADDMIERGYYGHVSPDGVSPRDWVGRTGYPSFESLGENIAKGLFTPTEVVERWLGSPHHRRNILDRKARQTGLGVAWGEADGELLVVWVQLFAEPR